MAGAYLIDTHALLCAADDAGKLGLKARDVLSGVHNRIYVSVASLWEMSIKATIGKLDIPEDFFRLVYASGYLKLPIEIEHLDRYRKLPLHHRDPFDRLLVAQADVEGLRIVSNDEGLARYGVDIVW
ncbi:MAG TPA: type II toxin-antitoxin system VapC family toxin [Gammaproteobacteria bacterium]|nr:type II toxin-antitoxin system VapC family toxin [Gammaproteobacteria bacterium]